MSIDDLIKEYKEYLLASGKKVKGITYSIGLLSKYLYENDFNLLSLNYREAQEFQSWLYTQNGRYSPGSIQGIIGPLNSMYNYLNHKQLINVNPFSLIDRIRIPFRIPKNIPTEKDMDTLLTHLTNFTRGKNLIEYKRDYKAHILCELLYSTGIRISEASTIKLEDINFSDSTILVTNSKNSTEKIVFLNDYIRRILKTYVDELRIKVLWFHNGADSSLLFGSKIGLKQWLNNILKTSCKDIGLEKVTSHIFRHSFGYHMLRAGCDIRKIQSFLGHKRLNTTQIYTKVDTEALRNILDQYHPRQVKRT